MFYSNPGTSAEPAAPEPEAPVAAEPESQPVDKFADWPAQGGIGQPQPWDLAELGLDPRDDDARTPVEPRAGLPLLTYGSQGAEVRQLGQGLAELGYPNSVSEGTNPYGLYDESVHRAVESFRRDYDVAEDPSAFIRDGKTQATTHAGPWTQEAVLRACARAND
jgi:hypothetical protein